MAVLHARHAAAGRVSIYKGAIKCSTDTRVPCVVLRLRWLLDRRGSSLLHAGWSSRCCFALGSRGGLLAHTVAHVGSPGPSDGRDPARLQGSEQAGDSGICSCERWYHLAFFAEDRWMRGRPSVFLALPQGVMGNAVRRRERRTRFRYETGPGDLMLGTDSLSMSHAAPEGNCNSVHK